MVKLRQTPLYGPGELPVEFTPMTWDNVIVGEEMGPIEFATKLSTHEKHANLLQIHHPWFEKELHVFPFEMICNARVKSRWKYGRLNLSIAASMELDFFKPAKVGQKLLGEVVILDKYRKRGKIYEVDEGITRDENGGKVFKVKQEIVLLAEQEGIVKRVTTAKKRQEEGQESWEEAGEEAKASKDLPIGFVLKSRTRGPLGFEVSGFVPTGWAKDKWVDNIHSEEYAKSKGYRGALAEGPVAWEFALLEMLSDFFGIERLFTTGKVAIKFVNAPYLGDSLIGKAKVIEKVAEPSGTRLVLATRVERHDGDLLNVGTASAIVD